MRNPIWKCSCEANEVTKVTEVTEGRIGRMNRVFQEIGIIKK